MSNTRLGGAAWGRAVLIAVAYFGLVQAAYHVALYQPLGIALIWPASGMALAALVRTDMREWPLLLGGVLVGGVVGLGIIGTGPWAAMAWTIADVSDPLVGAWLIRRAVPARGLSLLRVREVLVFLVFGGLVGPVTGTLVATVAYFLIGFMVEVPWTSFSLAWMASASLGVIGVAPLILTLGEGGWRLHGWRALEALALVLIVGGLVAFGAFTTWQVGQFASVATAAFPILAWAAIRFGPMGAAWGLAGLSVTSLILTLRGRGPFSLSPDVSAELGILAAQIFFSLAAVTAFLLAAGFDERRRQLLGQRALTEAGAILASFDPPTERLQRALDRMAGELGDSLLLLRPPEARGRLLFQAGAPPDRLGLRLLEEESDDSTQNCTDGRCWLVVPMRPGPDSLGKIAVRAHPGRHYFDRGEITLVEGFAHRVALALEGDRLLQETEAAVRLRDEFLSIASHELKTPLTPLATRLQLLRRRVRNGQEVDEASIEKAQASLLRLTWLINDLLDVSRIRSGTFSLHEEPVSMEEVVEEALAVVQPADAARIRWRAAARDVQVLGDRHRLEQVVANLVDNALKYSPHDQPVDVEVEPSQGEVVLQVRDRGPGIPEGDRERIFGRLFRGHLGTGARIGGLGLGLYIVRDIVERHGGRVWVEPAEDRGSVFQVALPRLLEERRDAPIWTRPV